MDVRWHAIERSDAVVWAADYGGAGPPVLLLHGLAGFAREWDSTAAWLARTHRVVALEARGHGRSERVPADRSPQAFAADVEHTIEQLGLAPTALVGQSLGGLTALLVAAREPDLVRALVVAEATPAEDAEAVAVVRGWLATWPLPFASAESALAFFGGDTLWARTWCAGLERRAGGFWPAFDSAVLLDALAQASAHDHWGEWARVRCPALVVRAADGVSRGDTRRMLALLPGTQISEIQGAAHDVHLEQPERWQEVVTEFLAGLAR